MTIVILLAARGGLYFQSSLHHRYASHALVDPTRRHQDYRENIPPRANPALPQLESAGVVYVQ